jgi:molybdopterin converting factor small subunit
MNDIVLVRVPAALRAFTGGADEVTVPPGTVAQVLQHLAGRHPQLLPRVLTPDGQLRPFVNVYVGHANVRGLKGLETDVPAGTVLSILPAVAGG